MPSLRIVRPGQRPWVAPLSKHLVAVGSGEENDIVLPGEDALDHHATIRCDGRQFHLSTVQRAGKLLVNDKIRRRHALAHGDRISIGRAELFFSLLDDTAGRDHEAEAGPEAAIGGAERIRFELAAYRKLLSFSQQLMEANEVDALLETLLDRAIEVTGADKGFVVLVDPTAPTDTERWVVKTARDVRRETLDNALERLSDSIVAKVVRTLKPILISDALRDAEFATAVSVMNLKLSSVLCVPLLDRGQLLGVLYVGNDRITALFEPVALEVLTTFAAQAALLVRNALLVRELRADNRQLHQQLEQQRFGELVGSSPAMRAIFSTVQKVAGTEINVLITGETGTGKELIARELHRRSPRAHGPFVAINCGAIPGSLLESELFGHVKGAFTGAVATRGGKFQAAHGGTLFLDELGDMPLALQVKILRALEERVVTKVGDTRSESVDLRLVAATHRQLDQEVTAGRFREDLYYRIHVVHIALPPLRQRGDDAVVLASYFLRRHAAESKTPERVLSPASQLAIRRYGWPGNIRQLENLLKRTLVLSDRLLIEPEDLALPMDVSATVLPLAEAKEQFQRDYIQQVLAKNGGNRSKTARDLGVDPRTIFRHLERGADDAET
jgi:transcriptional regulator with GAF, ATPase, and Fis domain